MKITATLPLPLYLKGSQGGSKVAVVEVNVVFTENAPKTYYETICS